LPLGRRVVIHLRSMGDPMKAMLCLFTVVLALFAWSAGPALAADAKFQGVDGCTKACHKKEKDGDQKGVWMKSGHSKAYKALASKEAKEKAAKLGVSGDPQKAENCLVCHTTGFGEPASRFDKKFDIADGVQCEACHGAGEKFRKKSIMKKIREERGPDHKGESATAKELGLILPTEKDCKRCHVPEINWNGKTFNNPSYKEFDFKKYFEKMKHPVPS